MDKIYSVIILSIFLLFLLGLLRIVIKILISPRKPVYKAKGPYLLSKGEKAFFDTLINSISSDLYVCPKVRLADLIEVNLSKEDKYFWRAFNKISQKHIDFVICDKLSFSPKLVIELDGGSHNSKVRSKRDIFVDDVLKQSNIPVLHIQTASAYDSVSLTTQIQDLFQS